ncbi:MAG: hypothetical protein IJE18_08675 [Bacteroidaceae bacterium]|nr:hypothetical protein [Bacteroidaceae bacterium]
MKMIDKVMNELQKQGFLPQREDFGIAFKYQMAGYLFLADKTDDDYFSLYIPYFFEVDEENKADVLEAMNAINNDVKVVKLVINDGYVWACFEEKLPENANIEDILFYSIVTLYLSRQQFYEKLKEV